MQIYHGISHYVTSDPNWKHPCHLQEISWIDWKGIISHDKVIGYLNTECHDHVMNNETQRDERLMIVNTQAEMYQYNYD
jgi:hypothetical protein